MFLIRADGNARIGAGHLMRCMAVAEELAQMQGRQDIRFVCADAQSAELAESYGFQSHVLGTDYRDMESELPLWEKLTSGQAAQNVLLVDSYYVTDGYLAALKKFGYTVLMDDYGTHCYPVDCVINYNAPADLAEYQKLYQGQDARLFVGSDYVPLRRQFTIAGQSKGVPTGRSLGDGQRDRIQRAEYFHAAVHSPEVEYKASADGKGVFGLQAEARTVLITTGGGDVDNIGGKILEEICTDDMVFHLVTGQFNPHFQELAQMEKSHHNIHIHHNVSDMAGLMGGCDIAVTAGGFTIYELAAVGVPFLCFSYAENQELLTEYIGREKIAGFAGAWHKEPAATLGKINELFKELASNGELCRRYSEREREMIDGQGAKRLARVLAGRGIS